MFISLLGYFKDNCQVAFPLEGGRTWGFPSTLKKAPSWGIPSILKKPSTLVRIDSVMTNTVTKHVNHFATEVSSDMCECCRSTLPCVAGAGWQSNNVVCTLQAAIWLSIRWNIVVRCCLALKRLPASFGFETPLPLHLHDGRPALTSYWTDDTDDLDAFQYSILVGFKVGSLVWFLFTPSRLLLECLRAGSILVVVSFPAGKGDHEKSTRTQNFGFALQKTSPSGKRPALH